MRPSAAHMEPGAGVTARDMRTRSARPARGPQNTGELLKATPPVRARMGGARRGRDSGGRGLQWAWLRGSTTLPRPVDPRLRPRRLSFPHGLLRAPQAVASFVRTARPRPGLTHADLARALCGHLWQLLDTRRGLSRLLLRNFGVDLQ